MQLSPALITGLLAVGATAGFLSGLVGIGGGMGGCSSGGQGVRGGIRGVHNKRVEHTFELITGGGSPWGGAMGWR